MEKLTKRLTTIRLELQKKKLKKSGKNEFANFDYYELADILPSVNEACDRHDLITIFNATKENATLTIMESNKENPDSIKFEIPFSQPVIPGANEVQNLGGAITYLRRYLFINAFEICEDDPSDAVIGKKTTTNTSTEKTQETSNVDICQFGKDKEKLFSEMENFRQYWYINYFDTKVQNGGSYKEANQAVLNHLLMLRDEQNSEGGE